MNVGTEGGNYLTDLEARVSDGEYVSEARASKISYN